MTLRPTRGASQATPATSESTPGPLSVSFHGPAMTSSGSKSTPPQPAPQPPGTIAPNGITTGIGQQGSGTAIGQQGTPAIGQQGTTAIGQQGVGTAIIPETNAVVIGQPEPTTPAPTNPSPTGFTTNLPNRFGQGFMPTPGVTNAPRAMPAQPAPTAPINRAPGVRR
jgi:hypothetical protein